MSKLIVRCNVKVDCGQPVPVQRIIKLKKHQHIPRVGEGYVDSRIQSPVMRVLHDFDNDTITLLLADAVCDPSSEGNAVYGLVSLRTDGWTETFPPEHA